MTIEDWIRDYRAANNAGAVATLAALRRAARAFAMEPDGDAAWAAACDKAGAGDAQAALRVFEEARAAGAVPEDPPEPPALRTVANIADPMPEPVLSLAGGGGVFLARGETAILGGAGGVGKSALAGEIALAVAGGAGVVGGAAFPLFAVHAAGPVLWLAYEETPGAIAARLRRLARVVPDYAGGPAAVHIADMSRGGSWALFGPGERGRGRGAAAGLYNARPERLRGWAVMESYIDAIKDGGAAPALIVIDPVLAAFVGEGNAAAPVREFLAALRDAAGAGAVLALAHSTKAARKGQDGKPDPMDAGAIGGSAAWTDGVRAALSMYFDETDARRLAVLKANYGPARKTCGLWERRPDQPRNNWIVGFEGASEWRAHTAPPRKGNAGGAGGGNAGGAGKGKGGAGGGKGKGGAGGGADWEKGLA